MLKIKKAAASAAICMGIATLSSPVFAAMPTVTQQPGFSHWLVRLRAIDVVPDVSSSTITTIGGKVKKASTQVVPELDFSYFFTRHIAAELILATSRHTVKAEGTALDVNGKLNMGQVSILPPTLLAQWHFLPGHLINPYVGAGINYTIFYNRKNGPGLKDTTYTNSIGPALQIGTDIMLSQHWAINFDLKKVFVKTKAHTTSGNTRVSATVHLDPWIYGVGVGYYF